MRHASNRQLTLLRKLNRRKYRERENLFFAEGERAVEQILRNGVVGVRELFFDASRELWKEGKWSTLAGDLSVSLVDPDEFREIADTETPQGVLALCEIPPPAGPGEMSDGEGMVIATDALQDPGNLGTIVRSGVWFGASGLVCGKGTVDLFHPKVVRGTAGSTGSLPWTKGALPEIIEEFQARSWKIWRLSGDEDAAALKSAGPSGKDLLIVGNEAHGISEDILKAPGTNIQISRTANREYAESLNAAMALSIALYHFGA